jgi:hypothetical protein
MIIDFLEDRFFKRKKQNTVVETLLIDLSAVLVWRGTWRLMDKYLFPNHLDLSLIFSIVLGIALVFVLRNFNKR